MCQTANKKSGDENERQESLTYGTLGEKPVFDKGHILVVHLLDEPENRHVENSRIEDLPILDLLCSNLLDPEKIGKEPFDCSYDHGPL
jgi:hypothetical protein